MYKIFRTPAFSLVGLLLFASGCATILYKKTPITVKTTPAGANLTVKDRKGHVVYNGKTPALFHLKPGGGYFTKAKYYVYITMPGYEDITDTLTYRLNGMYFGNILIGGLLGLLIVDPLTGAMWVIKDPIINEELKAKETVGLSEFRILNYKNLPESMISKLVRIK